MHSLDLLHKCHAMCLHWKSGPSWLQRPQLHACFFSTTSSPPRFPSLINSKAVYIFRLWWYSLWAWLIPFRLSPTPSMSATPSTLFKLRQGALPHYLTLSSPRVVAVISNTPLLLFPVPVHPPHSSQSISPSWATCLHVFEILQCFPVCSGRRANSFFTLYRTGPLLCLCSVPSFPFHLPARVLSRRTGHFCSVQYEAPLHTGPVHLLFPLMLCISRIKHGHSKYVGVLERELNS